MLKNKKIYVGKHGKEIQKKAFELGWKRKNRGCEIMNTEYPFFYFTESKNILCESNLESFNSDNSKEITREEMKKYKKERELKFKIGDKVKIGNYYGIIDMLDPNDNMRPYAVSGRWTNTSSITPCTEEEIEKYFRF